MVREGKPGEIEPSKDSSFSMLNWSINWLYKTQKVYTKTMRFQIIGRSLRYMNSKINYNIIILINYKMGKVWRHKK